MSQTALYAEESAEVEVLYATLDKLKLLTKKIQGSVDRSNRSARLIETAIEPIHSNTQVLQTTCDNVDRLHNAILKLREPVNIRAEEEAAIRAGPQAIGTQEYLLAMRHLEKALSDITATNLRANQKAAQDFRNLLAIGSSKLQEVFKTCLLEDLIAIEPLHYITKQKRFPLIPSDKLNQLAQICEAITSAYRHKVDKPGAKPGVNPAIKTYADVRGAYITNSLSNLATASINTAKRRLEDGLYKKGTNGIGIYASSMEAMIVAEDFNISSIFPLSQRGRALEMTCVGAFEDLQKTLRELNSYIQDNMMTDCFLGFEILEIVSTLALQLSTKTGHLRTQVLEVLRPIRDTCKASLSEILDQTKQKSGQITLLPNDGASVPLVTETMTLLATLATYDKPLASILGSLKTDASSQSQQDSTRHMDGSTLLAQYVLDMLEALLSNLDSRGRAFHRNKLAQGAFLANTICVIDRVVGKQDSSLGKYASSALVGRLEMYRKRSLGVYLEAWREPSSFLLDVQHTSRTGSTPGVGGSSSSGSSGSGSGRPTSSMGSESLVKSLHSKDREVIKDKFKGFNASFEEIVQRHRGLFLEPEVKAQFSKEVHSFVEPLYARFYDRYAEIDRGRGKYVKFDKAGLTAQLTAAFASTVGPGLATARSN
ncbi:exocyst complex component exo70 [Ascosphaera acerosa]|nr:exocyst complex component exo70 [Ascosphaera acerosa]